MSVAVRGNVFLQLTEFFMCQTSILLYCNKFTYPLISYKAISSFSVLGNAYLHPQQNPLYGYGSDL